MIHLVRIAFLMGVLLLSFDVSHAEQPTADVNGEWSIESFVLRGEPVSQHHLDRLKKSPLLVKDNRMIVGDGGTWIKTLTYSTVSNGSIITFDDSKTPGAVKCDMLGYDGWHGIYKIDGNTLIICRCSTDDPMPTEFSSTTANGWQIRTYTRVKDRQEPSDEPSVAR